jgi:hypothetical protein
LAGHPTAVRGAAAGHSPNFTLILSDDRGWNGTSTAMRLQLADDTPADHTTHKQGFSHAWARLFATFSPRTPVAESTATDTMTIL